MKSVDVFVRRSPVDDNTPSAIESVRESLKEIVSSEPQELNDVGDTAFWVSLGGSLQLNVFKGSNLYLIITVNGFTDDAALEVARGVALTVLERLP